ncbi:hypothetical protein [Methanomethylovorans sp.]|uniref:hypothetical protein n=1 Tax=Methanomethylovorans sp. TaxID=2758717 RepID=UPI00345EEECE
MLWCYSKLDKATIESIEELEKKLNVTLLAFSGQDIKNAKLTADELKQVEELENKLGLSLVAVKT